MEETTRNITTSSRITEAEAKKCIAEMNLINGFLFDSTLENKEEAKIVVGNILNAVFDREFTVKDVTSQKVIQAIDTTYHGIRLDAHIEEEPSGKLVATVFDMEMEDRPADKKYLPKRLRFYGGLYDTKTLKPRENYDRLPNFISITILSFDPFDAGDMYYEARSVLISHPEIEYKDGIRHIFLYCNGRPNFDGPDSIFKLSPEHSKKLQEMLKYIVSGQKPDYENDSINAIDSIVSKVKSREEVTKTYMKQFDLEWSVRHETMLNNGIEDIRFDRDENIPREVTRKRLLHRGLNNSDIDDLFAQVDAEEKENVIN